MPVYNSYAPLRVPKAAIAPPDTSYLLREADADGKPVNLRQHLQLYFGVVCEPFFSADALCFAGGLAVAHRMRRDTEQLFF
jgi:hypothetical protein